MECRASDREFFEGLSWYGFSVETSPQPADFLARVDRDTSAVTDADGGLSGDRR